MSFVADTVSFPPRIVAESARRAPTPQSRSGAPNSLLARIGLTLGHLRLRDQSRRERAALSRLLREDARILEDIGLHPHTLHAMIWAQEV